MSVNRAILIGRLGTDPELRKTNGGTAVVNIRLATDDRRKENGEWVEHTEWHNITVWDKQAENVNKYCRKGKQIFVEGRIQTRKWQDRDGNERYSTEIVADRIRFLGSSADDSVPVNGSSVGAARPQAKEVRDEDIPF